MQNKENHPQTTAQTATFQAINIKKSYEEIGSRIDVLTGVDLHLNRGEMISIVGASGTGKTTLLHILGTLDRPTAGTLLYEGVDVLSKNDIELSAYRNRTVGFVFQFHHLLPEFTALENVMMPGLIGGRQKAEMADQAAAILGKVKLSDRTHHKVGELSGGEQQRVALARAIIMKPLLLLADEPTGNLDTKTGYKVFQLLQEMSAEYSLSAVMVTHNLELANETNRCLTLADGKLHE
ncbi:MAG: ABC transporter ATP-binding protein [Deltaproteobacteria bacterium]|jgi:lipoprotein-releasing system ATP-binding protein|nr:ABC transporter ATP-binding protein [Deltaproteobacteria bacterium]